MVVLPFLNKRENLCRKQSLRTRLTRTEKSIKISKIKKFTLKTFIYLYINYIVLLSSDMVVIKNE